MIMFFGRDVRSKRRHECCHHLGLKSPMAECFVLSDMAESLFSTRFFSPQQHHYCGKKLEGIYESIPNFIIASFSRGSWKRVSLKMAMY